MNKWLRNAQNLLLPTQCLLCGAPASSMLNLCDACGEELPRVDHSCPTCGIPSAISMTCSMCQRCTPTYARTFVAFRYRWPIKDLIHLMKFQRRLQVAHVLGMLMAEYLASRLDTLPELIVPVPLHRRRLRERGFNQALEMGRPISGQLAIPMAIRAVDRSRATLPQSELASRAERYRNLKGAFNRRHSLNAIKHVAILDDVMTTGSTVEELARVLRRSGIGRVDVWSCARSY